MNPLFATWHREVSLDLAGIDVKAREGAADSLASGVSGSNVIDLISISHGQPVERGVDTWLRSPFQEVDPTFAMRGNDVEMQILAAAILEQVCRAGKEPLRILASYAVEAAAYKGFECGIAEVRESAQATIHELGTSKRQNIQRPTRKRYSPYPKALREAIDEYPASHDGEIAQKILRDLALAVQGAHENVQTQIGDLEAWTEQQLLIASEDATLLWWLLSGRSRTVNEKWVSLSDYAVAVTSARELAASLVVSPAPPQADALLQQMVRVNLKKDSIKDFIPAPLHADDALAFLLGDIPDSEDRLGVARHALAQAMLVRAWSELP